MPLTIQARQVRGVAILDLNGTLTIGPSLAVFETCARKALSEWKPERLLLNAGRLTQIDSAGIGEVVRFYSVAAAAGCRIAFVMPGKSLRQVLRITRVDGIVPIFEDEAAALAAP